jgi:hypothetical protein
VTNFVTHARDASAKARNIAGFDVGKGCAIEPGMTTQYTIRFQSNDGTNWTNTATDKETAVIHAVRMKSAFASIIAEVFCATGRRVFSTESK